MDEDNRQAVLDSESGISAPRPLLTVVLPCFNEEENVRRIPEELVPVLQEIGAPYEIVLVDDGSVDNTVAVAENLRLPELKIIRHASNKGLGEAIKTAFANTAGEIVVTLDADFSFHPRLIIPLFQRFQKNDVDLVIGSPALAGIRENVPFYRMFISRCANEIYKIVFNRPVTAISQILRIYRTDDVKNLTIEAAGFDIFAEILFKLIVVQNKRFAEIPAPFTNRLYGISKLDYRKETARHLKLLLKMIAWKIKNLL